MASSQLTAEFVRSILNYDPKTGVMTWAQTLSNRAPKGSVVKYKTSGYPAVRILGKLYRVHRLAWLIMTGEWPEFEVDHRDTDRANNIWKNLRASTSSQNKCNRPLMKNNASGVKGVYWCKNVSKWRVKICINGNDKHIGLFDSLEDARAAYAGASEEFHGEFGRTG